MLPLRRTSQAPNKTQQRGGGYEKQKLDKSSSKKIKPKSSSFGGDRLAVPSPPPPAAREKKKPLEIDGSDLDERCFRLCQSNDDRRESSDCENDDRIVLESESEQSNHQNFSDDDSDLSNGFKQAAKKADRKKLRQSDLKEEEEEPTSKRQKIIIQQKEINVERKNNSSTSTKKELDGDRPKDKMVLWLNQREFSFSVDQKIENIKCKPSQLCRPVSQNHIKYLIRRLEESNEEDRRKIIYHTLMVGYQSDEGNGVIVVIDGNHRILAIKKWNEKHPNDPIQHLYFDIILTSKPSLFAAVHICNFSAQEAERDMLPYSRSDVIRLARQLLMEEPSLGLSDIVEAKQTKQRALETDLVSTLAPILNVDKDKIPCIVWKLTRIQNEDFEKVLPGISSFTTNKQISKSVTSYERRQKATIEILSKAEAGSDLEMKIDSLTGKDWAFILREKNIWHFGHDEDAHLQVIMGTRYSNIKNKDKTMEAFLLSGFAKGVSNYKRYPNAKAKRRYLKQQFEKWIQSQPLPTAVPDNRTSEIIFDQATLGGGGNAGVKAEIITIGSDKPPSTAKPTNTRAKNTLVLKNIKISDAKEKYVDMFENTILKKEMAAFASYMLSDMSKNKGDFSSHEAVSSCTPFIIRQGDFDIQKFLNSIKKAVEDDAAAKST